MNLTHDSKHVDQYYKYCNVRRTNYCTYIPLHIVNINKPPLEMKPETMNKRNQKQLVEGKLIRKAGLKILSKGFTLDCLLLHRNKIHFTVRPFILTIDLKVIFHR